MAYLICPICFTGFQKPYCWVRRSQNNYCGRGCAAEAKKVRIEKNCIVCGKVMSLTPTYFKRIVTCSRECKSKKKRLPGFLAHRNNYAYRDAWKEIVKIGVCKNCGVTHGPWTVRNLKVVETEEGLKAIPKDAFLLCRHCALLETGKEAIIVNPNHIKHRLRNE